MLNDTPLDDLVHNLKSRCEALIDAADRLRRVSAAERRETLRLMLPRAEKVVELLKDYRES